MKNYYATFPAGTFGIIAKHLKHFSLDELRIDKNDDSSVFFQSPLRKERLIELRYFTNIYLVIDEANVVPEAFLKGKYFRLMQIKGSTPKPLGASVRNELITRIKREYKLEPNTYLSRNDFYLIERASGSRLFALKLPRAKFKREKIPAGELRPELAHILCLAAGLRAKHMVVDCFAGYGSIPFETVRGFGCKQVIAVDTQELFNRREHSLIEWHQADACSLDFLTDNSVDKVITDPPWGIYDNKRGDLASLYDDFIKEVVRVLKPGGVVVILSGFINAEQSLENAAYLKLLGKWNILVSGKKAIIYKLQKTK